MRWYQHEEQWAFLLLMLFILAIKTICFACWQREDLAIPTTQTDSLRAELKDFGSMLDSVNMRSTSSSLASTSKPRFNENNRLSLSKPFDPNAIDSSELVALGLKPSVAKAWVNYRRQRGGFRTLEDVRKVYGLSESVFVALQPYMQLSDVSPLPLELNTADSASLVALPGIGPYTAMKILRYREQLGGYYSMHQLDEIPGLRPENLQTLKSTARIDLCFIRRLQVNRASLESMRRHPYVSFYQAQAICSLRHQCQCIDSLPKLKRLDEFEPTDLERLRYYLSFDF